MRYVKELMESRPYFERVPDQGLIADCTAYGGANHQQATRGENYAFLYTPKGLPIYVNMGRIAGETVKASWFNPRTGQMDCFGEFENKGIQTFVPPVSGRGSDWVLVLDSVSLSVGI